jgi:hypothetical protein
MIIRKIDGWIGKHLFFPPIVKACQVTGLDQFSFANHFFILQCLVGMSFMRFTDPMWTMLFILTGASILFAVYQYKTGKTWRGGSNLSFYMRIVFYILLIIDIKNIIVFGNTMSYVSAFRSVANLVVFYAIDIKIIPPSSAKEVRVKEMVPNRK